MMLLSFWVGALTVAGTTAKAAQAAERGPRLTDAELLQSLNLEYPGLETVAKAVDGGDQKAALKALADFFRRRKEPFDFVRKPNREPVDLSSAESILKHDFTRPGDIPYVFPGAVDWYYNPTTVPGSKYPRNYEWQWGLNRHYEFETLALAYRKTGDEKYAREFAQLLESWIRDCPVPEKGVWQGPGSPWRTIECGIRTSTTWVTALTLFRNSPSVGDRLLLDWLKMWIEHARYLLRSPTDGNWLTMEMNGLYHIGTLVPFAKEAESWRTQAAECLAKETNVQVYPDGAQKELTPHYHNVALRNMLAIPRVAEAYGHKLPAKYIAGLEKMFAYDLWVMQPDRKTPDWNDSGHGDITRMLADGAALFPNRQDFLWVATNGKRGAPPDHTSHYFPWAGQVVMRSGWDREALFLGFEVGPFGDGHQHEDKLAVVIFAKQPLLVEGGTYTYDASPWRSYVKSSLAHNLVLVDGGGQQRKKHPVTNVADSPTDAGFLSDKNIDFARGVYDDGFEGGIRARHTREVLFDKTNKLFVVRDQLASLDGKEHLYEALWHLDAPRLLNEPERGIYETQTESGGNLRLVAQTGDGLECRVVKGQEKPVVQGWQPLEPRPGIRPIPCVICSRSGERVEFLSVFQPLLTGGETRVAKVNFRDAFVEVIWSDSRKSRIPWPKSSRMDQR
jgi:hypothetical protein